MTGELAIRFVLGGVIVSLFALVGETFKPKTFGGLFGAAPSVAIASLGLAYASQGAGYVAVEARSMVIGAAALLVYSAACVALARYRTMPVWLSAGLAWVSWLGVALGSWHLLRTLNVVGGAA